MELKFLKNEKNEIEVEINNLTLAEILRVYLNKDSSVVVAAWKREHFTKSPVLKIKTKDKDAKSVVKDAIKAISGDLDNVLKDFKSM